MSPATGRSRRKPPLPTPEEAADFPELWPETPDSVPVEPAYLVEPPPPDFGPDDVPLDLGSLRTQADGAQRRPATRRRAARDSELDSGTSAAAAEALPEADAAGVRALEARIVARLNPEQARAVTTTDGPLLILAGAGSGKTRVLAHRVAYLIGVKGVRPWQILAVTFTNRAAAELRERIIGLVGEPGRDVQAGTFHAICARVLRRDGEAIGINRRFVIYDTDDQAALMKQILKAEDMPATGEFRPSVILGAISRAKNEMVDPDHARRDRRDAARPDGRPVRAALPRAAAGGRRARLRRPADRGRAPVRAGAGRPAALPGALAVPPRRRVPGHEPRRSTCGSRRSPSAPQPRASSATTTSRSIPGAAPTCATSSTSSATGPDATVVKLEQNYRSTQLILDAAHAVVSNNEARKDKKLWTENAGGLPIQRFEAYDEEEEAEWIARQIEGADRRAAWLAHASRRGRRRRPVRPRTSR